jgi:hypothetical protein
MQNNMALMQNLYLAFALMATTNKILELGV